MTPTRIFAQVAASDMMRSISWFTTLFDRSFDTEPMASLREWHFGDCGGFQLFEEADRAGHGTVTIIVSDLDAEQARLAPLIGAAEIMTGDTSRFLPTTDPDGNRVILAQPLAGT